MRLLQKSGPTFISSYIIHPERKKLPICAAFSICYTLFFEVCLANLIFVNTGGLQIPVCGCVRYVLLKALCTPQDQHQVGSQDIQPSCGCKMVRVAMVLALKRCGREVYTNERSTRNPQKQNMDETGRINWSVKKKNKKHIFHELHGIPHELPMWMESSD